MGRIAAVLRQEALAPHVSLRRTLIQPFVRVLPQGTFPRLRTTLYRAGGASIGRGSVIMGPLRLWGSGTLHIGDNSTINPPCAICLDADVHIGDGVLIGHDTVLATGRHEIGPPEARGGPLRPASIVIEDGVWVGAGVLILPGVTIGAGAVIAGGAVVHRDVQPDQLVAGVPAQVVKTL